MSEGKVFPEEHARKRQQQAHEATKQRGSSSNSVPAPQVLPYLPHHSPQSHHLAPAGSAIADSVVGESVVPSLMQVYESMTGGSAAAAAAAAAAEAAEEQEQQHVYYGSAEAGSWAPPSSSAAVAASNISIPPIPSEFHRMGTTETAAGATAAALENPSPAAPHPSRPTRTLRKRSRADAAASNLTGGGASVMAATTSSSGSGNGRSSKTRRRSNASGGASVASSQEGAGGKSTPVKEGSASVGGGNGKGDKSNDGRWSKRFTWPEELHRDFVAAIFDVGLKHSSPSTLLEIMPKHPQITTERIKSHLQKYRLHRVKSKKEFMASYAESLAQIQADPQASISGGKISGGAVAGHLAYQTMSSADTLGSEMSGISEGGGGGGGQQSSQQQQTTDSAAYVTVPVPSAQPEEEEEEDGDDDEQEDSKPSPVPEVTDTQQQVASSKASPKNQTISEFAAPDTTASCLDAAHHPQHAAATHVGAEPHVETLQLPRMTEAEKKSPMGAAMGYLMGLFFSLQQQLMAQRAAEAAVAAAAAAAKRAASQHQPSAAVAVYHSFRTGHQPLLVGSATATADPLAGAGHAVAVNNPSTRTNLEENSIMKREMESQMVFQNKMRALKQQELEKYNNQNQQPQQGTLASQQQQQRQQQQCPAQQQLQATDESSSIYTTSQQHQQGASEDLQATAAAAVAVAVGTCLPAPAAGEHAPPASAATSPPSGQQQQQQQQRARGISVGNAEEFWNTDLDNDDQLFEFLMSDG